MTQEEKARAYDEALEKAKKELQTCGSTDCDAARQIYRFFPELKESEDERIRKAIIEFFESEDDNTTYSLVLKKDILAWLEKQADKDKLIKELGKYKVKYTQEVLQNYLNSMTNKDDERLRKTTIAFLKEFADKGYENAVECIDWLEKQGKTSPFNKERLMGVAKPETEDEKKKPSDAAENLAKAVANAHPSFDFKVEVPDEDECPKWFEKPGEKPQGKTALEAIMEEKSPAESLGISPEKYEEIVNECIYGESVDKVVPKFKIGDWVVFIASENVYQVEKIENYEYTLRHTLGGSMPLPFSSEELIRPWTIKDVKPGDVLVGKIDGDNYILIFKQIKDGWIETYGHYYDAVNRFCIPSQLFCRDYKGTFYPATKEQRDTLAKAMAEEGYTFDFEKKELKKIDTLLDLLRKMPSCITVDGIDYHFVLKKTIAYMAFYEGEGDGSGKVIFWMAGDLVPLLTAMLNKLKEEGLLE